jgi:hypothetical protein
VLQNRAGSLEGKKFFSKKFRPLFASTYEKFFTKNSEKSAKTRKFIQRWRSVKNEKVKNQKSKLRKVRDGI